MQGFEYGDDDGDEEPMMDAQEIYEEEYEDPQREFATPAGSQSGESPDLLGMLARILPAKLHSTRNSAFIVM